MLKLILLQLFWFSFVLIGLALFLIFREYLYKKTSGNKFYQHLRSSHAGVLILYFFIFGVSIFCIPISAAYIFEWPIQAIVYLYFVLLLLGLVVIVRDRIFIKDWIIKRINIRSVRWCLIGLLVIGSLVLAYLISLHVGAPLDNDVPHLLSKVQLALNLSHFTLGDPFVGYHHILDPRYSTNLMLSFEDVIARILNLPAYKIWEYSNAFYQLVIWMSLFALTRVFLPSRFSKEASYLVLIFSPFVYTGQFFMYAELPHFIVLAWTCLFLIGLKLLIEQKSYFLAILSSLLIAETHALAATISLSFLLLFYLVGLLFRQLSFSKKQNLALLGSVTILGIPVIANFIYPTRSTNMGPAALSFNQGLHSLMLENTRLGGIVLPDLTKFYRENYSLFTAYNGWQVARLGIFVLVLFIFLRLIKWPKVKLIVFLLLTILGLYIFNTLYVSLIGYGYLVLNTKNKSTRLVIFLAIIYFALVAFNPVVLTVANNRIPLWTIARFQDFNMFAYIAPFIGLLFLYKVLADYWKLPKLSSVYILLPLCLIAGMFFSNSAPIYTSNVRNFNAELHQTIGSQYTQLGKYLKFNKYLSNQIVFTNDAKLYTYLPIVAQGKYIGYLDAGQASQTQNYNLRTSCQRLIFKSLNLNDIENAGVTRVVLVPGSDDGNDTVNDILNFPKDNTPYNFASERAYLKLDSRIGNDAIYSVIYSMQFRPSVNSPCYIPNGQ